MSIFDQLDARDPSAGFDVLDIAKTAAVLPPAERKHLAAYATDLLNGRDTHEYLAPHGGTWRDRLARRLRGRS